MSNDELALTCMQEERDEFENNIFELLFGAEARPAKRVEEYQESTERVFTYEDAQEELAEVNKSLQLLYMIKEHISYKEDDDTEEKFQMRELIGRLTQEIEDE